MLRRRFPAVPGLRGRPPCPAARAPQARAWPKNHPRPEPPRGSPIVDLAAVVPGPVPLSAPKGPVGGRRADGPPCCVQRPLDGRPVPRWDQRPGAPAREPFRLAFFSRLSYWWDIRCACICAMKSITTTTTISSEVPPK